MSDHLVLRTATDADMPALSTLISGAFLRDSDEDLLDVYRLVAEPDRAHVITDADQLVGTGAIFTRELSIPGGSIPAAHVTAVAVASTHRRRGLLTRIMAAQFEHILERRTEPVAVLWASEGAIYGRFGYGPATWQASYDISRLETTVIASPSVGTLHQVVPREATAELGAVFETARSRRPGMSSRDNRWWKHLTADPKQWRDGRTALRGVLHEGPDGVEGYATWRLKSDWGPGGPSGQVRAEEVVAASVEAYRELWRFLLSIDLTRSVRFDYAAVDEPLPHLLTNPAVLGARVGLGLWVRIIDVPAALAARRYAGGMDVVLEVSDVAIGENAGRWRLSAESATARCERTSASADLTLDVRHLGAAYLGGVSLTSLGAGGLVVEHTPGALAAASTAFGWPVAPLSIEVF